MYLNMFKLFYFQTIVSLGAMNPSLLFTIEVELFSPSDALVPHGPSQGVMIGIREFKVNGQFLLTN